MASLDKPNVDHLELGDNDIPTQAKGKTIDEDTEFSPEEQTRIIRRIDCRLILTCGVLYCICQIDRGNLGYASIAGMREELDLSGYNYSIIILVFFPVYILAQPPATIICRKLGPRPFLAAIAMAWGIVMLSFGFPNSWTVLIPLRIILGALEAGFFPGVVYLISTWYTRYELQKRYAVFYVVGFTIASGFSGILAYGLSQMDGVAGYSGWRWIFIMEGIMTCLLAATGYFALVDFPEKAAKTAWRFLDERECGFLLRRIARDRDDVEVGKFDFKEWASSALDPVVWGYSLIFFCLATVMYSISYFLPIILNDSMGFSMAEAQCLVAPPYVLAAIVMYINGWVGDRYHIRGPLIFLHAVICGIGNCLLGFARISGVRYFGVFLLASGLCANIPCLLAYQANNIRGQWKRAFCSALIIAMGGVGGVAGSLVFRSQDAPNYLPGIWATIACNILIVIVVSIMMVHFRACNRRVDGGGLVIEGLPGFKYTI